MRSRVSAMVAALVAFAGPCCAGTFAVLGAQAGSWPDVLSSVGHVAGPVASAGIIVARPGASRSPEWQARVEGGAALILEASSPLAESFGFRAGSGTIPVIHIVDEHNPSLPIIWSAAAELPRFEVPKEARVFAKDRWTGAPLIAGFRLGQGAVLWVAADPGPNGYERFPYLIQALADLGITPDVRAARLWAFFDYSYRLRADVDYLAEHWRKAGISALHVASWHFFEPDRDRDAYLMRLIEACHRRGILVYAWVELPHVSEKFWNDHPEWREKTGLLQDAQLDWRKLMNLENHDCAEAVRAGLRREMERFDWDGVNLAELYFESLEGAGNQARFTPMNADVRTRFKAESGWDPVEIWNQHRDAKSVRQFLDFRADLVRRMQETWLGAVESFRSFRPDLDVVLTHVDDRFDAGMKDAIGADASRVLPLLDSHSFSFLIEDPATVWNLGPRRYGEIAKRYHALTPHADKLGIDINIVERYQDVYPTKQQTGIELFELVHLASASFPRVALYFENSIPAPDLPLLAAASVPMRSLVKEGKSMTVDAASDFELAWRGSALVDGTAWPLAANGFLRLPAGRHTVEPAPDCDSIRVLDVNARLLGAAMENNLVKIDYESGSRAVVRFDRKPARFELDGAPFAFACAAKGECSILLPRGHHQIRAE
jgi:hypothetical protein